MSDQTAAQPSHTRGDTDVPLLEETIGANLERTVAAHGDREALVAVSYTHLDVYKRQALRRRGARGRRGGPRGPTRWPTPP